MKSVPVSEAERLFELHATEILDSAPSPEFDAIAAYVRDQFDLAICGISLIDRHRQWFKAICGADWSETPRDIAFCHHTVQADAVMVVEDATRDKRFQNNPLVTGEPRIRFYAGAPIRIRPGVAVGSLCILDTKPRTMSDKDRLALRRLSDIVASLIRGHRLVREALLLAAEADRNRRVVEEQRRLLELRERRFKQTEMAAKVGGWDFDIGTRALQWSDEIYRIHDIPIGTPITFDLVTPAYRGRERAHLDMLFAEAIATGKGYDDHFELISATGTKKWIRSTCEAEMIDGKAVRLFGTSQDVSDNHRIQVALWDASNKDSLTRLSNRKHFNTTMDEILARDAAPGLLMVDVDHLKLVNDTLGHAAGDALIVTVAARLTTAVGSDGFIARLGGDEFAVILDQGGSSPALTAAGNAILRAMQPELVFGNNSLKPQVSVGGAVFKPGDTAETLYTKADLALYHAKRTQRGTHVEFHDDLQQSIVKRVRIVREIEDGLRDNRIVPYYQPVMALETSRIVGFEARARLKTKDNGIIAARQFEDAFRDANLARRLTDRMLGKVAADMRGWLDAGADVMHVGVNVTGADLLDPDLPARLSNAFRGAGVPLKHVIVEVTETMFTNDREHIIAERIKGLRSDGILVALDDFGTGQASLTHLRSMPVDIVKINSLFTSNMLSEPASGAIVETLLELGRRLGMRIVAEGIDNQAQLDHLLRLGCKLGQGAHFAPAMDRRSATRLLTALGQHRPKNPGRTALVA